jgi:chromosome segregation ATPase
MIALQSTTEKLQKMETDYKDLENKLKSVSNKYVELVKQLEPKNRQTNELSKQVDELQLKKHALEEDLIKSQKQNKDQIDEITKLKDALKSISEIANTIDHKAEEDALSTLQPRLKTILENYQKADNEQKGTIKALQLAIEHNKEDHEKKLNELESHNAVLRIALQDEPKPSIATAKYVELAYPAVNSLLGSKMATGFYSCPTKETITRLSTMVVQIITCPQQYSTTLPLKYETKSPF